MKLPNPDQAFVELKKLEEYCLSPTHLRGKHKAKVFKSALELTHENAEELKAKLLSIIKTQECNVSEKDHYGQRYIVYFSYNITVLITLVFFFPSMIGSKF